MVTGLANYCSCIIQCAAQVLNVQSKKKYFFQNTLICVCILFYFCCGSSPKSMKVNGIYKLFKIAAWKIKSASWAETWEVFPGSAYASVYLRRSFTPGFLWEQKWNSGTHVKNMALLDETYMVVLILSCRSGRTNNQSKLHVVSQLRSRSWLI